MSFGHALYYPHINLLNKNWIKHALLFWDNISRIIPHSVEPIDGEDIIRIKDATDFIKDYHPDHQDTSRAFNDFFRELKPILESDNFFRDKYERIHCNRNYWRDYYERKRFFSELVESTGTYVHTQKMDPHLKEYLYYIGVAIPGRQKGEDWIKIDREIGLLYMTYFAKSISLNKSLPIVTDVESSFSASLLFESSVSSDFQSQFEYKLGNLLIDSIVPKNINNVPIDKLLMIRNKYDDERTAFFNEISNLTNSLVGIDNENALKDALNQHAKLIRKEVKILEQLYNSQGIETIYKFLSISVPTTFVSISEYVPGEARSFIVAGGLLFGLISGVNSVKKERLELKENPKSYLLNLKSELSSESIYGRIIETIKGLRKW